MFSRLKKDQKPASSTGCELNKTFSLIEKTVFKIKSLDLVFNLKFKL